MELRPLARNVFSNSFGFFFKAAVALLLTPYVYGTLGEVRYGVWISAVSVTGAFGVLDVGFTAAATQFLTRYRAEGNYQRLSAAGSTALAFFSAAAAVALIGGYVIAQFAGSMFNVPADLERELSICVLLVALSSGIQFLSVPYASSLIALQRFDVLTGIGVLNQVLMAISVFAALAAGRGLIAIAVATTFFNLLASLATWFASRRLMPEMQTKLRLASKESFSEMAAFGGWSFADTMAGLLLNQGSTMVVATTIGPAAVARFALASGMTRMIDSLLMSVTQTLYPVAINLHARKDQQGLRALLLDGSRFLLLVQGFVLVVAVVFAVPFYEAWIGPSAMDTSQFAAAPEVFQWLLFGLFVRRLPSASIPILRAMGRVGTVAVWNLAIAVLAVIVGVIVLADYGLIAFAIGILLLSAVSSTALARCAVESTQTTIGAFLRAAIRPAIAMLLLAAVLALFRLSGEPMKIMDLVAAGAAAALAGAVLGVLVGMSRAERRRIVWEPLQRLRTSG